MSVVARMSAAVAGLARKLRGSRRAPRPEVVEGTHALPEPERQVLLVQGALWWHGAFFPCVRRIFVNATAVRTPANALAVARHELAHCGLRDTLRSALGRTMDALRRANPKLRAEAARWTAAYGAEEELSLMAQGWPQKRARKEVRRLAIEEALADRAARPKPVRSRTFRDALRQQAMRMKGGWKRADQLERRSQAETSVLLERARCAVFRVPAWLRRMTPQRTTTRSAPSRRPLLQRSGWPREP